MSCGKVTTALLQHLRKCGCHEVKWQIKGGCQITKLPFIALMMGCQASSIGEGGTESRQGY